MCSHRRGGEGGVGGGVGGEGCRGCTYTPPLNIHYTNYLIQERPSSLASEPQIAPEALSWHKNLKHLLQHAQKPLRYINMYCSLIPGFAWLWAWVHTILFEFVRSQCRHF